MILTTTASANMKEINKNAGNTNNGGGNKHEFNWKNI